MPLKNSHRSCWRKLQSLRRLVTSTALGLASLAASATPTITAETITPFQETLNPGQTYTINYKFSATAPTSQAYKVFLHIIDSNGNIKLQDDHYPPTPTTSWSNFNSAPIPDVSYTRNLTIPSNFATGSYTILVGLYNSNSRLELTPGERVTEYSTGSRSYVVSKLVVTSRQIRNAVFTCGDIYSDPATWPDRTTEIQSDFDSIVSGTTGSPGEIYKLPLGGCKYSVPLRMVGSKLKCNKATKSTV